MTWNYDLSQLVPGRYYTVSYHHGPGYCGVFREALFDSWGEWKFETFQGGFAKLHGTVYAFMEIALPDPAPLPEDHAKEERE